MFSKKSLAIELSKLKVFDFAKPRLEQYPTESDIAADMLQIAYSNADIVEKAVLDLGAGTGILGIGALFIGAAHVVFVEKDMDAIKILKHNLDNYQLSGKFDIIQADVNEVDLNLLREKIGNKQSFDTTLTNPPFGTRNEHIDMVFLKKGFELSNNVYSFHKTSTFDYINKIITDNGFKLKNSITYAFPLKSTMSHHTSKIKRIEVDLLISKKN